MDWPGLDHRRVFLRRPRRSPRSDTDAEIISTLRDLCRQCIEGETSLSQLTDGVDTAIPALSAQSLDVRQELESKAAYLREHQDSVLSGDWLSQCLQEFDWTLREAQ